jgi:hypothetical protein
VTVAVPVGVNVKVVAASQAKEMAMV